VILLLHDILWQIVVTVNNSGSRNNFKVAGGYFCLFILTDSYLLLVFINFFVTNTDGFCLLFFIISAYQFLLLLLSWSGFSRNFCGLNCLSEKRNIWIAGADVLPFGYPYICPSSSIKAEYIIIHQHARVCMVFIMLLTCCQLEYS